MLTKVIDVAKTAGAEIMRFYEEGVQPEIKRDGSMVTPADRAAEKIIREGLAKIAPNIPFVGEESVEAGIVPDVSAGTFWCVDPLDGTRNFVERNGKFGVLIGLIENGAPSLGVLYAPFLNVLAFGGFGHGAFVNRGKGDEKLHDLRAAGANPRIVVEQRIKDRDSVKNYAKKVNGTVIGTSNAWPFLEFAAGGYDICAAFSAAYEWDTAATHAILRALGGEVFAPGKIPLPYGKSAQKFKNPNMLASHAAFIGQVPDFE